MGEVARMFPAANVLVGAPARRLLHLDRGIRAEFERLIERESLGGAGTAPAWLAGYIRLRFLLLRLAVRQAPLWIPDSLNVTMAATLGLGDIVLDIGANIGLVTAAAACLVGDRGKVYCFEPGVVPYRYLCSRIAMLRLRNVVINRLALGESAGEVTLYEFKENFGGASSLRQGAWPGHVHKHETTVEMMRLSDYVKREQVGTIRLIKLDVQGAEIDVLRGAGEIVRQAPRPVLFVEVERDATVAFGRSPQDLLDLLDGLGYAMYSWRRSGLTRVQTMNDVPPDGHDDVICLDSETHEDVYKNLLKISLRREEVLGGRLFGV